jgi:hypothetical protein
MKAIVLERQKMVTRRLTRYLAAAGFEPVFVTEPGDVDALLGDAQLLCCDAFDGDLLANSMRRHTHLKGVMWTAEPLNRCLRFVIETPKLSNVFGRLNFESAPRGWELLMVLRRMFAEKPVKTNPEHFLSYGFGGFQVKPGTTDERDETVAKVQEFVGTLGMPKRIGEGFAELTHELLMNAMYDAPVDAEGNPKYAQDRKQALNLTEDERPLVSCFTDGHRLVLQVADPFGRLERKHVFAGLARGLAGGEMDRSHGGAGLGMMVCHNSTGAMFYDVVRGQRTTATGIFDLEMNLREFRTCGKSLHYFESEA